MVNRRDTLKIAAGAALGTHFASSIALAQDDQVPDGFFLAPATGGQEVPPLDTEAQGGAVFALNEDGSAMDYALAVQGIVDVNQAHIHQGPAGENGEVVVWLYPGPATQEPQTISGRFDGVLAQGTIESDDLTGPLEGESLDALLQAMAEDDAYVNVHTEANPPGEIRGQIVTVDDVVEALDLEAAAAETATETPGVETETETSAAETETETPAAETETETPAAETETETPAAETETETPEGAIDSEGN
jgi:hypothetical protein